MVPTECFHGKIRLGGYEEVERRKNTRAEFIRTLDARTHG
jgi:hypothetical protein